MLAYLSNCRSYCFSALLLLVTNQAYGQEPESEQKTAALHQEDAIDFVRDVQPIFRAKCFECHAGSTEEGGLNLAIKAKALKGGDSAEVLIAGNSAESLLIDLVSISEGEPSMPPEGKDPLTAKEFEILQRWIDQGAKWPDGADVLDPRMDRAKTHWAFQRLKQTGAPERLPGDEWSQTAIDLFVHRKLNAHELRPSKPADARTLVRRIYFDLIGLPPNQQQVHDFIAAHSREPQTAVVDLVDQLLESPRYGERWARHWLDVARYADSAGQEADEDRPHAYHYRDFVIEAFNGDMPYDQFVRWQIAGDEYEPDNDDAVAATGFLTAGTSFQLPETFLESERLLNRYNELDDIISTLGSGMLGITVACARCHDHKYDAFSSEEYYELMGVFHSGDRVTDKLPSGGDGFFFKDFDSKRRTTWLFHRSDFYNRETEVDIGFPSMISVGAEATEYWQRAKEDYAKIGEPNSTLQRRALADWITDTEQGGGALLARVFVNRVWHHHFGRGLVKTTSDFGVRGDAPTHPDLLEHLTAEFVAGGWQTKSLHRKILCSSVWQQSSTRGSFDDRAAELDPQNELLWKMTPQRLEVEAMRDAMLAVSDRLNLQAGGPGFKPYIAPEANLARNIKGTSYPKDAKDDASNRRRSVYMFHKRLIPYPMFQAFDRPDLMTSCARRQNTTVAPQAMVLLNDKFVRSVSRDLAELLIDESDSRSKEAWDTTDFTRMIELVFEKSFSRMPSQSEVETSIRFIQSQTQVRTARDETNARTEALADYCQSLFGLNEFIYVD